MKKDIIKKIRAAHRAHMSWVSKAVGLIEGLNITAEACPLHATDCAFGKWYYDQGQVLKRYSEYQEIERPHMDLHQLYMQIFTVISGTKEELQDNRSFFDKLVGRKPPQKDNKEAIAEARRIFKQLQTKSDIVINCLNKLEQRVSRLDDAFFHEVA